VTRAALPVCAALAASAALLLTACGGGGSDSADKARPSDTGTPSATATSASPSATASDGVNRPSTALPKDLTMTFDWRTTGNVTKDAVLHDGRQYVQAFNRAAALNSLKDPAYQFYSRDQALTYARGQITDNIKEGWAPTGLDRYDSAKVAVVSDTSATLTFCEDQSKNYSKELKTGKVLLTTPSIGDYYRYNLLLFKDPTNGVWQTSKITVLEAPSCKH
jgi:hypothetical protein